MSPDGSGRKRSSPHLPQFSSNPRSLGRGSCFYLYYLFSIPYIACTVCVYSVIFVRPYRNLSSLSCGTDPVLSPLIPVATPLQFTIA
ncbi:hypothetical protein M747DRAFT_142625 [Aspergillus niger ATCC 13496]|uniref:Uncharacterized protein n=1 Tax=Aspergillus niger ATCC 13496 TaxID=1353008 RepID=A0A370BQ31_ASPNG|nr:hypothetical protein M747DRAFT_142625 [Aspergillus niger ATCC 13496]